MVTTVNKKVKELIQKSKSGSVFFANSFPMFDTEYVGQILINLSKEGILIRIGQGAYLKPMKSSFGPVYPPSETIVKAIAKRDKAKTMPTGNTALNILGLSPQVPMVTEYLTSGSSRTLFIGERTITLRHSSPKNFAFKGNLAPLLIQALRTLGENNIDEETEERIRAIILDSKDKYFEEDLLQAPIWMKKLLRNLM